ncbi:hypothetical protein [Bifidobacterium pseudolongum]|uniref:XRE family transcriptional regulator n=1 Tax=Bifidobacterium pseudolongum subsp. globosum TaxID=1690 RepID=A0A4Q5AR84_9BIFI|nr:hypothetical protein [Bifidobacterium pseudolongum]MEE1296685.1 hypothetical protein [Bifidobacterium sp.]RYQ36542.1 hypothetical protein PG2003B_1039 [Bifidobacterium pseudolongum subsp. globosum]
MNYRSLNSIAATNIDSMRGATHESIEQLSANTNIPLSTLKARLARRYSYTLDEIELLARHWGIDGAGLLSPDFSATKALADREGVRDEHDDR